MIQKWWLPTEAKSAWRPHPTSSLSLTTPISSCRLVRTDLEDLNDIFELEVKIHLHSKKHKKNTCWNIIAFEFTDRENQSVLITYVSNLLLEVIFCSCGTSTFLIIISLLINQWRIRCWEDCEHQTCHPVLCHSCGSWWQEERSGSWQNSGMRYKNRTNILLWKIATQIQYKYKMTQFVNCKMSASSGYTYKRK